MDLLDSHPTSPAAANSEAVHFSICWAFSCGASPGAVGVARRPRGVEEVAKKELQTGTGRGAEVERAWGVPPKLEGI